MAVTAKKITPLHRCVDTFRAWLEKEDAYNLHKPVRKRFARDPYNVTKVIDLSDSDLMDVHSYAK